MNKLIKSIATTVAASAMMVSVSAMAELKIAVVNVQEVMAKLPQGEKGLQEIQTALEPQQKELEKLRADLAFNMEKKKRDAALMSKKQLDELDAQIQKIGTDYQTKGQALQQEGQKRQGELQRRLLGMVQKAIDEKAEKENFDMVVNAGVLLFLKDDKVNITQSIIDQVSKQK